MQRQVEGNGNRDWDIISDDTHRWKLIKEHLLSSRVYPCLRLIQGLQKVHKLGSMMMMNVHMATIGGECVLIVVDACEIPEKGTGAT
ncbi:hypothetical protein SUGI_0803150 [Cryptomeria japonica]|nr:hypothetical protein SUGI_0803150 [Cryptomeria japonica]